MKDVDELFKKLENIPDYVIELGVFVDAKVEYTSDEKSEMEKRGVNNAELMFIHENGTARIPKRPVLGMALKHTQDEWLFPAMLKASKIYLETENEADVRQIFEGLRNETENYAKDIIYLNDGRLTPNAESTALAKKKKALRNARTKAEREDIRQNDTGNHPLFDTGILAKSITARLIKVNKF